MKRRDFIVLVGGSTATWPFVAWAQQAQPVRRIGVLMPSSEDDPVSRERMAAFLARGGTRAGRGRAEVHTCRSAAR